MTYAVIGPFTAYNVRLDASASVSGLPAMRGIMGLIDVLRRQFATEARANPDAVPKAAPEVMIVLHDVQVQLGRFKPAPNSKGEPTEIPECIEGTVRLTLIVRNLDVSGTRAGRALVGKRFCGGNVVLSPAAQHDRDGADLSKILASLPPGRVVIDRRDLLERDIPGDPLDKVLHFLTWVPLDAADVAGEASPDQDASEGKTELGAENAGIAAVKTVKFSKKQETSRPEPGWLVPLAVGYQALEPVRKITALINVLCLEEVLV
jgi:hypothetical protein